MYPIAGALPVRSNIFLKLENLQPSGSFKSRGIGNMMRRALLAHQAASTSTSTSTTKADAAVVDFADSKNDEDDARNNDPATVHFYISSGGNAGLACATAAAALSRRDGASPCTCTIFVPVTTPAHTISKLRGLGAVVIQVGSDWAVTDRYLRAEMRAAHGGFTVGIDGSGVGGGDGEDTDAGVEEAGVKPVDVDVSMVKVKRKAGVGVYVPPFDHPHVWEGASTIVDEIVAQTAGPLKRLVATSSTSSPTAGGGNSGRIDTIVCSVGGGGLLNGIMEGIERHFSGPADSDSDPDADKRQKQRPRVLAVETAGADSLNQSVRAGKLVTLPAITSVATSLGAVRVSERAFQWATTTTTNTTKATAQPLVTSHVVSDADAVRGSVRFADDARMLVEVACGAAIAPVYNGDLRRTLGGAGLDDAEWARRNVVLVVCGGSNVTLGLLGAYRERFGVE
ncbi:catabolic L-serine/threonine dehydratase [Diatrype stigma]|uniref:L-serine ammonia-lyase n=1 Tax=Diatrype stigma TaxID=117547 RepID=A0AAN9YV84_9PEZI